MVPGHYINGMRVLLIDTQTGIAVVSRLGDATGQETLEFVPCIERRLDNSPPPAPVAEQEPPPQKKSWHQEQKELPKFLRPRKGRR